MKRTTRSHYDFDISIATASERIEDSDIARQLFLPKIPWLKSTKDGGSYWGESHVSLLHNVITSVR